jgi:hypothetical protein
LARDGFDLWQAGNLEESVAKYQQALLLADPNHFALADYDGEFAAVLATLGRGLPRPLLKFSGGSGDILRDVLG